MHEVRIENLEKIESTHSEVRILANSGDLALIFPRTLWERALAEATYPSGPTSGELGELQTLQRRLKEYAEENSFATILEDVLCGGPDSGQQFDLVLRPAGMFAATTGYLFLPEVLPEQMALLRANLEGENFVEQAYLVGAVADQEALVAGDERLKALSIRGRRCTSSRFELAPELWQVLAGLGWNDVEPVVPTAIDRSDS
jgi:hypothetical protein